MPGAPARPAPAGPHGPPERDALLRNLPGFGELPAPLLVRLAAHLEEAAFAAGVVVIREGVVGEELHVIVAGRAEVSIEIDGRAAPIAVLGPGECFGEIALLEAGGRRTATVTALEPLRTLTLPGHAFRDVLATFPHADSAVHRIADVALRHQLLKRAAPFAGLDPARARALADRLGRVSVSADEYIIRQGDAGDACYLVEAGAVDVLVETPDTPPRRVATLERGQLFGETALLTDAPRNASVRAASSATLLVLRRADLLAVMRADHAVGSHLFDLVRMRARPRRAAGVTLEERTAADGETLTVLQHRGRGRYFQLSPRGRFLWDRLDGRHTMRDLALDYFLAFRAFGFDAIADVIGGLTDAGFVDVPSVRADVAASAVAAARLTPWQRLLHAARRAVDWNIALVDVERPVAALYRAGGRWLCTAPALAAQAVVIAAGLAAFIAVSAGAADALQRVHGAAWLLPAVLPILTVTTLLHELGHALAVKHFGRRLGHAGIGWHWFGPTAYVDTSDMWATGRRPRIAVTLAGPWASALTGAAAALLAAATPGDLATLLLWQTALISFIAAVVNLNPLLELDGYYVLMDALERPNLRRDALRWLRSGLGPALRTPGALRAHRVDLLYGAGAVLWVVLSAAATLAVYRLSVRDWLAGALSPGLAAALAWVLVAMVTALPLLGMLRDLEGEGRRTG